MSYSYRSMSKKRKILEINGYVVGAILPIGFFPLVVFILQQSQIGSFFPVVALLVISVVGLACCVQGFRKSPNGWVQTVSLLLGILYLLPIWVLGFILSGPFQK
ncbi:MAG: hypothetical protein V4640_14920 [Verrucomicrobiota bacterium]